MSDIQYGAFLAIPDSVVAEAVARTGFDYVCIDGQHGLLGFDKTLALLQAMSSSNATMLVRVLANDAARIGRLLDAGADGIIVPMVNSAEEARAAVAATRYAPDGVRSFGPMRQMMKHGFGYYDSVKETVQVIPQIETAAAVAAIDEIVEVEGVTAVYIGPADLQISQGYRPAMDGDSAEFNDALAKVLAACERTGVIPAIHATNTAVAQKRKAQGFKMLTVATDLAVLRQGMARMLSSAKE
ncbi:MAG: aldolase/citrate lyase family protein [Chloroflexota bacterium]